MTAPLTLVLCGGGIRSLVAVAWLKSNYPTHRLALLHVKERRPDQVQRLEYVHRQAKHWSNTPVLELELNYPVGMASGASGGGHLPASPASGRGGITAGGGISGASGGDQRLSLFGARMLLAAMAQGKAMKAQGLIWPVQPQGDPVGISRATEETVLVQGLAQLEAGEWPTLQTPLLELMDRQVVELGGHLQVPWHLAWSCQVRGIEPCKACAGCRRRAIAFNAAGLIDPLTAPIPALVQQDGLKGQVTKHPVGHVGS